MDPLYQTEDEEVHEITIEELDQFRESCKHIIEMGEAARKLTTNPEFRAVVMEEYFEKEPVRLAGLMVSGKIPPNSFNQCVEDLKGIGHLRSFLSDFILKGEEAQKSLKEAEQAYNEAKESGVV